MNKAILAIIIALIILFTSIFIVDIIGEKAYNNGVCRMCGGHYTFKGIAGHAYTTEYVYICNTCGNSIEISNYYGE